MGWEVNVARKSDDCPFCSPVVEKVTFAESKNFLGIYNRSPILPGHSMVIPREHVQTILELSNDDVSEMATFARSLMRPLMRLFKATGFNWTIQQSEEGGQTVPHLHLHLIPRSKGDLPNPGDWYPLLQKSGVQLIDSDKRPMHSVEELEAIARKIRGAIGKNRR
jgi:bis(5'-adenosyl)-triphosphatase